MFFTLQCAYGDIKLVAYQQYEGVNEYQHHQHQYRTDTAVKTVVVTEVLCPYRE